MPAEGRRARVPPARQGRVTGAVRYAVMVAAVALQSCAAPPPPPLPPTVAKLSITATADANATAAGQGAPIIVRVYQLASTAGFEKAEFFRLLNADTATLGQDLVKRDEYLLAPGANKEETITIPDRVQALGVFAAYRQFQSLMWRIAVPLPANKTTPITLSVTASGLVLKP